jgi:MFS family permease
VSLGVSPAGVQYHYAEVHYKPVDSADAPGRGPGPGAPGASVFTHARALGKISLFGGLGGFLFGYDTGVISGALLFIREEYGTGPWTEGLIVGVTSLGALAGAAFGGTASDRHGRKRVVLFCDALYLIGAMIMAFSPDVFSLCVGRLLAGLAVGASSVNLPMYLSELAPRRVRGSMTSVNTVMIDVGQLAAYAVGAALAASGDWRFMLGLSAAPAAAQAVGMLWMPESPAWLAGKGLRRQAEEIARRTGVAADEAGGGRTGASRRLFEGEASDATRGDDDDVDDDDETAAASASGRRSFAETSTSKIVAFFRRSTRSLARVCAREDLRPQLRLAVILQVLQQAVGINAVMYYGATIIQAAGISGAAAAVHLALAVAATSALGSVLGLLAVDVCGRRRLLLASLLGCVVALSTLAFCFLDVERGPSSPVSEIATGTCAAATTCRECLAASCGFCAAGGAEEPGRCLVGTAAGPDGAREVSAAAAEEERARPFWYDARTRHPEDAIVGPPPPAPPTLDDIDLEADAASFEDFLETTGNPVEASPTETSRSARPPARPPAPRAKHRAHQNIVTCDGNWQFHSCPSRLGLLALAAQMLYVTSFQAGMSPVPWVVAAEIFPTDARGAAGGVAASANWAANLVVSATFPGVFAAFGGSGAFAILLVFALGASAYAFAAMPETRGLSPAEVAALMRSGRRGGGDEVGEDAPEERDERTGGGGARGKLYG